MYINDMDIYIDFKSMYEYIYFLVLSMLKVPGTNNTLVIISTCNVQSLDSKCNVPLKGMRALWRND